MIRVAIEGPTGDTAYGRVAARRAKTNEIYVIVDEKPHADGWYPAKMWQEKDD